MASTFTDLGLEIMATGENAGTWGDKTNTNLNIVNTAIAGYVEQSIAGGAATTTLTITDGAATSVAQNAVIKLTGSITGNQIVTIPDSIEKVYIITNGTSGAFTVQVKTVSGSGVTFGVSEKTTKLFYSDGTNIVDAGFSGGTDLDGKELTLDADGDTSITADTDDQIDIKIAGTDQLTIKDGALSPVTTNDIDLGTASLEFKNAFFDGTVTSDAFAGPLTGNVIGNVTGNVSGTAATVTTAAQSNITSLGTLTTLTVDDITINGSTISDAGDFTLDVEGDITLDANGADVFLKDAGTTYGSLTNSSGNLIVKSGTTTALTFSGADVTVAGDLTVSGDDITMGTNTAGNLLVADGTNFNSIAVSSLSAISTVAADDVFLAIDTSGGGLKKITRSAVVSGLAAGELSNIVEDTSPQLGGNLDTNSQNILIDDAHFIADESGNEQIIFQTTGSAVNQFDVTNAASGSGPQLSATGDDSNIDLNILAKGTGHVTVVGNTNSGAIQFNCESNTHGQILKSQPHSASVTNVMLLPAGADSTLVSLVSTDTLTNKTLTSPKINEDVAVTSSATEINLLDGATVVIPGKVAGTNFTNSLLVGHSTTGTLNAAEQNTGIGIEALDAITSGDDNTVVGFQAATGLTTGSDNTVFGSLANLTLSTAGNNSSFGYRANQAGNASNSTAFGAQANRNNTGSNNTAVGAEAMKGSSGSNTSNSTALGKNAGGSINDGDNNLFLGKDSGDNITSGNGNVIIGSVDAASATGDRQLKIAGNDGTNTTTWISGDSSGLLTFKRIDTGDNNPYVLTLQTGETDIAANDVLGSINFQAPDEGTGTDAILVAAGIDAVSEGDFSSSNNATKLSFKTGVSEAAAEKMSLSSAGLLTIADDLIVKNAGTIGTAADSDLLTMGNAILTVAGEVQMTTLDIGGTNVTSTAAELNKLDGVGTLKQAGKETIWVPANAMTPTTSNPCSDITTVETTSGRPDMHVLDFDKDSDEFAQFAIAFPKSYNLGTVTFQFFWSGLAATTGVSMQLQGVAMNDNETIDVAYGTAVVVDDDAQGAVEELLVSAESGAITIAGTPADNDLTYFRIGRDVSDSNDDMAGDCRLHGIKIFFTTDAANDA